jgi:hypothetical protein
MGRIVMMNYREAARKRSSKQFKTNVELVDRVGLLQKIASVASVPNYLARKIGALQRFGKHKPANDRKFRIAAAIMGSILIVATVIAGFAALLAAYSANSIKASNPAAGAFAPGSVSAPSASRTGARLFSTAAIYHPDGAVAKATERLHSHSRRGPLHTRIICSAATSVMGSTPS